MAQASPYHPLSGESYIRLLEIGPNGAYGPHDEINHITCSLYEVVIRRCTYEHSIFTALSYAWGSEEDAKQITLKREQLFSPLAPPKHKSDLAPAHTNVSASNQTKSELRAQLLP
jgi:hypothetical protein